MIQIKNIKKSFWAKPKQEVKIFEDFSLEVCKGDFVCILGRSGIGKSTLLNLVAGILKPEKGEINREGKISYIFQTPRLLNWRTVKRNLEFVLPKELSQSRKNNLIKKILLRVGLPDCLDQYPLQLSEGMKGRVAIARALLVNPSILLMDEPLSNLDEGLANDLRLQIKLLLNKKGIGALFVTHNIQEAISLSNKIIILSPQRPTRIKKVIHINKSLNTFQKAKLYGEIYREITS